MSEVALNIRANDRASATLNHVSRKLGLFNKQGLAMGVAFAGITMGIQFAMQAVQGFIQGIDEAFQKAREFERGMGEVATMLDENAEQHLPAMRDGIDELSTTMGLVATDLQRGLYQTLSASVDAAEAMDFLGAASKAAVAGLTSVETSVDALTTVMNAYGMTTLEVGRISDVMFTTVFKGKTTFEELANAIGYVVPIAAQAGVALEQVAAAFSTLTKQGIQTQRAATGLRALLNQLISPSKEAAEAAQQYGIILNDLSLEVLGLDGMMEKLTEATGGSAGALSEMIPNIRALTAAVGIGGDNLGAFTFDLNLMQNAIGATDAAFSDMANTLDTKFRIMEQKLEEYKRELGLEPEVIQAKKTLEEFEIWKTKALAGTVSALDKHKTGLAVAMVSMFTGAWMKGDGFPWDWYFKGWDAAANKGIDDILDAMDAGFDQNKITLDLNQLLEFEGAENMASKLMSMWDLEELDADTLIGHMNEWGRAIDSTTNLISRLETAAEGLTMQIDDLDKQIADYKTLKQYEEALHYIPLALEDASFQTKIFSESTQALVDSIRIQKDEIEALDKSNQVYAMHMRGNQLEALELQLKAMGRRGRLTRKERQRLDELKKDDLKYRIATIKNQTVIDKIKNDGLTEDQERLETIRRNYQEEIKIIKDAQDTTMRDMKWDLKQKMDMRSTYEDEYLPKVRRAHLTALEKYHAGLILIENKWGKAMITEWEAMAGSIVEKKSEILAAKAAIAGKPIDPRAIDASEGIYGGKDVRIPDWKWDEKALGNTMPTAVPKEAGIWDLIPTLIKFFTFGMLEKGTDFVPQTGLYQLHRGEAVTPAGGKSIHVHVDPFVIETIVKQEADPEKIGELVGRAIQSGILTGLESNYQVG